MISPPNDRQVFRMRLHVGKQHIDNLDHVNNVVYVNWVQDVAEAHWKSTASDDLRRQCRWVVMRQQVDYYQSVMEGEDLELITWVDPAHGPRQIRHVSIQRISDGKVAAYAETTWCLLDPNTSKPRRIGPEIDRAIRLLV